MPATRRQTLSDSVPLDAPAVVDPYLPAGAQTLHRLRKLIEARDLHRGDRLPSERALAERFGVARATVRDAFHRLQQQGLIYTGSRGERYLARHASNANRLMQHSIVMIGSYVGQAIAGHQAPGWGEFMAVACHRRILARDMHVILYQPSVDHEPPIPDHERRLADLLEQPPRGAVLAEAAGHRRHVKQLAERFRAAGVPTVAYGDDDDLAAFDRVASDHHAGAAMLTRWCLDQGRRRILLVGPALGRELHWCTQRRRGYEQTLKQAGLTPLPPLEIPSVDLDRLEPERRFEALARLAVGYLNDYLRGPDAVDAILCPSDGNAIPVIAACRILGRQPHRDVTVVGYDNYYADSPERRFEPTPPAATIDKRNAELGVGLVDLLLERLDAPADAQPVRRMIEPELIVTNHPGETVSQT